MKKHVFSRALGIWYTRYTLYELDLPDKHGKPW